jgi:hypothetical protein
VYLTGDRIGACMDFCKLDDPPPKGIPLVKLELPVF